MNINEPEFKPKRVAAATPPIKIKDVRENKSNSD